ncbi:hypothetical protein BH11VER1_BH11VER1_05820 [soil metagenome]
MPVIKSGVFEVDSEHVCPGIFIGWKDSTCGSWSLFPQMTTRDEKTAWHLGETPRFRSDLSPGQFIFDVWEDGWSSSPDGLMGGLFCPIAKSSDPQVSERMDALLSWSRSLYGYGALRVCDLVEAQTHFDGIGPFDGSRTYEQATPHHFPFAFTAEFFDWWRLRFEYATAIQQESCPPRVVATERPNWPSLDAFLRWFTHCPSASTPYPELLYAAIVH